METEKRKTETERLAYIMLYGKKVLIEEIHTLESQTFDFCHGGLYDGVIPIKIKSPCLEKAMDFCKERGQLRMNKSPDDLLAAFDRKFLKDVRKSEIDLVDLYHAAARLGIPNLENPLFNDVVRILCEEETTPEQLGKIFKVRYNEVTSPKIMEILDLAPPCPTLSKEQQEQMKLKDNREEILKKSSAEFTTLPLRHKIYWVYAHFVIKRNPGTFVKLKQISRKAAQSDEDEEEESKQEDDEEEKSKVLKNDHVVGGPGPRGLA